MSDLEVGFEISDICGFEKYLTSKFNRARKDAEFYQPRGGATTPREQIDQQCMERAVAKMEEAAMMYHKLQSFKNKP